MKKVLSTVPKVKGYGRRENTIAVLYDNSHFTERTTIALEKLFIPVGQRPVNCTSFVSILKQMGRQTYKCCHDHKVRTCSFKAARDEVITPALLEGQDYAV